MAKAPKDKLPKEEADKRRDDLARRILRTPPSPRGEAEKKPKPKTGTAKDESKR